MTMMGDHLFGKAAAIEGWSELCFCLRRGPKMREAEEDGGDRGYQRKAAEKRKAAQATHSTASVFSDEHSGEKLKAIMHIQVTWPAATYPFLEKDMQSDVISTPM